MKAKLSSFVGLFAVMLLVASFLVPASVASPAPVSADPGLMEWTPVVTPDTRASSRDELHSPNYAALGDDGGSEIIKLVVGNDGSTMYCLVRSIGESLTAGGAPKFGAIQMLKSNNGGRTWSIANHAALRDKMANDNAVAWDIAIAPDDPEIIMLAISDCDMSAVGGGPGPLIADLLAQQVWVSTDGGDNWDNTNWPPTNMTWAQGDWISCLDISMDYNGRDMLVGTRDGTGLGTNNLQVLQTPGFGGWNTQNVAGGSTDPFVGDVIDAVFSPTYNGDSTIVVVYTDDTPGNTGTYMVMGNHDLTDNETEWETNTVEVMNSSSAHMDSPWIEEILTADIELPSDFSGSSSSLRRVYICTDAISSNISTNVHPTPGAASSAYPNSGVYRVDDTVVYTLMDNSTTFATAAADVDNRRASSIAYWGTYASGKLLVGEVLGDTCTASVPVWFTDSPTVCPVPCWYPAKKPPTGAAGLVACDESTQNYGNAQVVWSPTYADQGVAYAVTGASAIDPTTGNDAFLLPTVASLSAGEAASPAGWPIGYLYYQIHDESAFSLTRNNGETWNQLSLIDTRMSKLTDVAPSRDCSTVYLASVNNGTQCKGFDSVWRSSNNEAVVAPPLPALPIGSIWERVRTSPTAKSCDDAQSNYAILRLAPDHEDGQVVFWAAGGAGGAALGTADTATNAHPFQTGANTDSVAWSPDYGDYWANINPRITVQDMAAESSTILYVLSSGNDVHKLPYTGTAWSSSIATVGSIGPWGHTIEAYAEGKVLVGHGDFAYPVAGSLNGAQSFIPMTQDLPEGGPQVGFHAIMDTDFDDNDTIYVANDNQNGKVYRNTFPSGSGAAWTDIMQSWTSHREYYGIVQTNSNNVSGQGTLYAAHAFDVNGTTASDTYCGVERTLQPLMGVPKPGVFWDCMDAATPFRTCVTGTLAANNIVDFTLEPKSLKLCGCLTQDTNTILWAIDNDWYANEHNVASDHGNQAGGGEIHVNWALKAAGLLWSYEDCVAKKGPELTLDDGAIIGCDPATGRNQEVNFTWEQLCIATTYQINVSKDERHSLRLLDAVFRPYSVTSPALIYLAGGEGASPTLYDSNIVVSVNDDTPQAFAQIPSLECGHTFYWKIRVRDETTGDAIRSPWSETRAFTIKAGFKVTTPYYGPQLLAPDNGCGCPCDAPVCFSWSPFKETTKYQFELSENADMSSPLVSTTVPTTSYQYDGTVQCNTNYFWRVMAVEPAPSEWSAVFSFMTQAEPEEVIPEPPPEETTPIWVWVIIAIGAILVIVTLILIFKTRRV